jgi:uncharacterized membrane protein
MNVIGAGATWLHLAATTLLLGHYALLRLVHLPVAERQLGSLSIGPMLVAIERRALPWLGASLATFFLTGMYLLLASPRFEGLGHLDGSAWTVLLLIKHVVVVLMVVIAVAFEGMLLGDVAAADADGQREVALRRVRLALDLLLVLGSTVILLTAAAQALP